MTVQLNHRTLVKLHGYIAVLFLPMAILYAVTGTLYILGESGAASTIRIRPAEVREWPESVEQAAALVNGILRTRGRAAIGSFAEPRHGDDGSYVWRAMDRTVTLSKAAGGGGVAVRLEEHGTLRQLVEVHKNHAGIVFSILGIAFGIAMSTLLLTGALMMFKSRLYRKSASAVLAAGVAMSAGTYFLTLYA